MDNFNKLVEHFIFTGDLGDYNKDNYSITLYDIRRDPVVIEDIKRRINEITTKYKFVVLHTTREFTNIKILDIDL